MSIRLIRLIRVPSTSCLCAATLYSLSLTDRVPLISWRRRPFRRLDGRDVFGLRCPVRRLCAWLRAARRAGRGVARRRVSPSVMSARAFRLVRRVAHDAGRVGWAVERPRARVAVRAEHGDND